jgi:DNA-binding NarL/FixJ family response regulator
MPPRILIVDDSAPIRRLVRSCAEAEPGWSVCAEAANGKEAIQMAQRFHPNLVIMDLSMPQMNGLEAAKILHGVMPSVPLIMFTIFSTRTLEEQAFEAGFSKVILKTQRLNELIDSIRSLVAEAA